MLDVQFPLVSGQAAFLHAGRVDGTQRVHIHVGGQTVHSHGLTVLGGAGLVGQGQADARIIRVGKGCDGLDWRTVGVLSVGGQRAGEQGRAVRRGRDGLAQRAIQRGAVRQSERGGRGGGRVQILAQHAGQVRRPRTILVAGELACGSRLRTVIQCDGGLRAGCHVVGDVDGGFGPIGGGAGQRVGDVSHAQLAVILRERAGRVGQADGGAVRTGQRRMFQCGGLAVERGGQCARIVSDQRLAVDAP